MNKKIRYLYWFTLEFIRKHNVSIILTFVISFIIITFFSWPIQKIFFSKKRIGLVGSFSPKNLPEEILYLISNPLLTYDEKGNYTPILLSSWEVSNNYKVYRLTLKKKILWNDKEELTTSNLNIKIKDAQIKVIDRYSMSILFSNSTPNFLNYLSRPIIKNWFVGAAGKYRVKNYQVKNGFVNYLLLFPNIDNLPIIEYKIFPTEEDMALAYKMGQIDSMTLKKKNLVEDFTKWKNSKITKLVDYKHIFTIFFNNEKDLFKNKDFKKALIKAIDKKKFSLTGIENSSPVPLNSLYYNANLPPNFYSPDYLKEYVNSQIKATSSAKIKLNLYTYYDFINIANEIIDLLNQADIETRTIFIRQQIPKDYDLLLTYLEIPSIEDQYLLWHSEQKNSNISHYKNERVDKLLENLRLSPNFKEKKQNADDFQKNFLDDPGAIFLFHPYVYLIERKYSFTKIK